MDCVRARVRLNIADKDGVTARTKLTRQLQRAESEGGPTADIRMRLAEPAVPPAGQHLWDWFWELDAARPQGTAFGRILYSEVLAWAQLTGSSPTPTEVEVIRLMDGARLHEADVAGKAASGSPATAHDIKTAFAPLVREGKKKKPKSVG